MKTATTRPTSKKRRRLRYVVIVTIATTLLLAAKLLFEHTRWGHDSQLSVFGVLQSSLSPIDLDNPVVVLDIAQLPGGRPGQPTSRDDLKKIISALADIQPQPRAIAVDVNFSPKGPNYSAEQDEDFFDFCLSIRNKKRVPIFLAIAETKSAPPEAWLGSEDFKDLAVAVAGDKMDTSHIPLWIKSPNSPQRLNMLSYALALEYRKRLPEPHFLMEPFVETHIEGAHQEIPEETPIDGEAKLVYEDRLVNFSKLDQMKIAAHPDVTAESVKLASAKYADKLVILGDLDQDKVFVPGRQLNEAGSLVLAAATYTLIKEPLYEFKPWVRVGLALFIVVLIVGEVALIRRKTSNAWFGKQAVRTGCNRVKGALQKAEARWQQSGTLVRRHLRPNPGTDVAANSLSIEAMCQLAQLKRAGFYRSLQELS